MAKGRRSFAVIGLGTFGSTIAKELAAFGNPVLGIDVTESRVARLADELSEAVIADGRDEEALREAGVPDYDAAVVAIGEDLEASVMCTMNVKLLGVKSVWVKAMSRTHHRILSRLGADRVLRPEEEIGRHIAQMLHNPLVRDYVSLGNGFHVVDLKVPESLDGQLIGSVDLLERYDLRVLGVMRGTEFIPCDTDVALHVDDKVLLLGRRENLRRFSDSL